VVAEPERELEPAPVAEAAFLCMQLVAMAPPLPVPLPGTTAAAAIKGFTLLPPLALAQSQENDARSSCCLIEADWSLEFFGPFEPLYA
jgi:hypothetical protein